MDLIALADAAIARLLAVGLQSLILAALVWALCRYLPRLDARTRAWLWWLVATQMVVGLVWHAPVALPLLPAEPVAAPVVLAVAADASASSTPAMSVVPAATAQAEGIDTRVLLLAAWLAGIAVMLANTLRHAWRLRGQIARAQPCRDRRVLAVYGTLVRRLGIAAAPALRVSDEIDSPMLARPWRPVLLLPADRVGAMSDDDLQMALHHELAHLQRRDLWWAWMPALAQHLFFFHPVAHLAAREYAFAREVACDAAVLQDEQHAAHDYGRLLVKLGVSTAPSPALAGASPTFRILKRRLLMLQHTASPLRTGALALTLGIVLLGVVPYRVIASSTPKAAPAPMAPIVAAPVAASTVAPHAEPVVAPSPRAAPRPIVVADARDMPAPPAPPAPPPAPTIVPPPAPAPPAAPSPMRGTWSIGGAHNGDAYVLIDDDRVTMAGHSDDIRIARALQQGKTPVLWLRQDGREYIVRDPATVRQVKAAHAPVEALGAEQGKLGERQGALGERQGALGVKQGELGMKMAAIGVERASASLRRDDARDAARERRMNALQDEQEALARQQEVLARQQEPLARQQEALARKQVAATDQLQRDVDRLLDEAIRSGKAQRL
ncbi:M56 family metallopeptidase [Pseudoxanthomonas sp.]|jgi:beta-lactamase regulating signal transducer with metallopeptidase domain|uniref:M56 family metallopeptidase n=1 Tax=Pseudoxanthomonas sp. TaxID=1871049 RepID=UPI002E0D6D55|nr:M56 family metallopeptidase [Pseudoxanthomonas sp.]